MRKLWKITKIFLLSALGLLILAVTLAFVYRVHVQHVNGRRFAIHSVNGIDEAMYVKIGGIDQWVQIRGQDRNNPVLLCLHGGPGATWSPLTSIFLSWEKEFTVVQWDQRGAGRTLEATGSSVARTMSIGRMAQDGIEVSEFLRNHLRKDKLVLLGHSWGSILGVHMVEQRPDLFYAYVGTGQVANMQTSMQLGYRYVLDKARAAGDNQAVTELESIGTPPYDKFEKVGVHFKWLGKYEAESDKMAESDILGRVLFGAPNLSVWDAYNRGRGFLRIPTWTLYQEMLNVDLASFSTDFNVPIFFFQGRDDEVTPASLAEEYLGKINAPHKEYVPFEDAGHFAVWTMPDRFFNELVARVRHLATQP
jgi:pimeloyl-ACP methyl ester carboxylesterase